jgi:hypothetical protein
LYLTLHKLLQRVAFEIHTAFEISHENFREIAQLFQNPAGELGACLVPFVTEPAESCMQPRPAVCTLGLKTLLTRAGMEEVHLITYHSQIDDLQLWTDSLSKGSVFVLFSLGTRAPGTQAFRNTTSRSWNTYSREHLGSVPGTRVPKTPPFHHPPPSAFSPYSGANAAP